MSFTVAKDRAFAIYNSIAYGLARSPRPLRFVVYYSIGAVIWVAYLLPGNKVRPTMFALAQITGQPSAWRLFNQYVGRLIRGSDLAERIRHGFGAEVDGILTIEHKDRLDNSLARGGAFLVLPHLHASVAMARNLARDYEVLTVIKLPTNPSRAQAQMRLYEQVGGDVVDVRNATSGAVTRKILRALKGGKIVIAVVDRIRPPPDGAMNAAGTHVRATVFGQEVGVDSWTSRFAMQAQAPIIPATVLQTGRGITLVCGTPILPADCVEKTTRNWIGEMETLLRLYPQEWTFSLDKQWSRLLTRAMNNQQGC